MIDQNQDLIDWQKAPGLSNLKKTEDVYEFLVMFQSMLAAYRSAFGEPAGLSVESKIDTVKWYLDFHKNREQP